METVKITGVKIKGVVGCVPENLVSNKDSISSLFNDKIDTLIKATGISHRAIAKKNTTSLDLCIYAAEELIANTNTNKSDIGAIIQVTFTPEYLMPGDAQSAQTRLGLSKNIIAFDINMACSGYGYALYNAALIAKSINKKVLLLDGDVQSKYVSKKDKSTVPVLADAGTATIIEPAQDSEELFEFSFYSDGSRRESLFIPSGGSKNSISESDIKYKSYSDGSMRKQKDIYMDGFEIFRFVAKDVSRFIEEFIIKTNKSINEFDNVVFHQANMYMIDQLAKKIKIEKNKVWKSGQLYGNPSSCSVPLTIAHCASKNTTTKNKLNTLISGFGGGLSLFVGNIILDLEGYYKIIRKG